MSKKSVSTAVIVPEVVIEDVKGIWLTTTEQATLASMVSDAERELTAACHREHTSIVDGYIAVGKAVLALRAVVESNLANLGNYTSFKSWMGDKKFGPRAFGYKQCTIYATIGKHPDVARTLYMEEGIWSLNALASAVNEATGNTKSGGRKAASESEGEGTDEAVTSAVTTNVTSLEAVLAFIGQADISDLETIVNAARQRWDSLEGAE